MSSECRFDWNDDVFSYCVPHSKGKPKLILPALCDVGADQLRYDIRNRENWTTEKIEELKLFLRIAKAEAADAMKNEEALRREIAERNKLLQEILRLYKERAAAKEGKDG